MRRFLPLLFLFLAIPARAETPSEIPNPLQTKRSFVADSAGVLTDEDETRLQSILAPLERKSSAEMAVVTVHNLGGQSVEDFTSQLFSLWKVGKKGKDNGVILLVAIDDRKSRIQVGYGLEDTLTDGQAGELLRDNTRSYFRKGDYATGITNAVVAVAQKIDHSVTVPSASGVPPSSGATTRGVNPPSKFIPQPSNQLPQLPQSGPTSSNGGSVGAFFVILGLIIFAAPGLLIVGLIWFLVARLRRPPACPKCKSPMNLLPETMEAPHLTAEQNFEQRIGSKDYQVWQCPNCQTDKVAGHDKMSFYTMCPKCRNRTAHTTRTFLQQPTRFQQGLEQTSISCEYPGCGYTTTYNRSTGMLSSGGSDFATGMVIGSVFGGSDNSSSNDSGWSSSSNDSSNDSSSSSGSFDSGPSDFGGGDSGGGGASDSW